MRKILGLLLLLPGWAQACLFATSTSPEGWLQWSSQLFGGEVTSMVFPVRISFPPMTIGMSMTEDPSSASFALRAAFSGELGA